MPVDVSSAQSSGARALRSQPVRDRIAAAARKMFGREGFERTTIRAVAAQADIHPFMVMRYFGSKEGLFAAATVFDLRLPDLAAVPRAQIGETLVQHFLERWEGEDANSDLPALLRVAVTHEIARNRLIEIFTDQVTPKIAKVCAPDRAFECAALIGAQILGLALTRDVLMLPPMIALSHDVLVRRVGTVIQNYIDQRP